MNKSKKKIPEGKKGKGIKMLKKKAPEVAARMGYSKGGDADTVDNHAQLTGFGAVRADVKSFGKK